MKSARRFLLAGMLGVLAACGAPAEREATSPTQLLNVSYDPTREFYREANVAFQTEWPSAHDGAEITVEMSHG